MAAHLFEELGFSKRPPTKLISAAWSSIVSAGATPELRLQVCVLCAQTVLEEAFAQESPIFPKDIALDAAVPALAGLFFNIFSPKDVHDELAKGISDAANACAAQKQSQERSPDPNQPPAATTRPESAVTKSPAAQAPDLDALVSASVARALAEQKGRKPRRQPMRCPTCLETLARCCCKGFSQTAPLPPRKRAPPVWPGTTPDQAAPDTQGRKRDNVLGAETRPETESGETTDDDDEENEETEEEEDDEKDKTTKDDAASNAATKAPACISDIRPDIPQILLDARFWPDLVRLSAWIEIRREIDVFYARAIAAYPHETRFILEILGFQARTLKPQHLPQKSISSIQETISRCFARLEFYDRRARSKNIKQADTVEERLLNRNLPKALKDARREADRIPQGRSEGRRFEGRGRGRVEGRGRFEGRGRGRSDNTPHSGN